MTYERSDIHTELVGRLQKEFPEIAKHLPHYSFYRTEVNGMRGFRLSFPSMNDVMSIGEMTTVTDFIRQQLVDICNIKMDVARGRVITFYSNLPLDADSDENTLNLDLRHPYNTAYKSSKSDKPFFCFLVALEGCITVEWNQNQRLYMKSQDPVAYAAHCKRKYFTYMRKQRGLPTYPGYLAPGKKYRTRVNYSKQPGIKVSKEPEVKVDDSQKHHEHYRRFMEAAQKDKALYEDIQKILEDHNKILLKEFQDALNKEADRISRKWLTWGLNITEFK